MRQKLILALAICSLSSCVNTKPCPESHPKIVIDTVQVPVSAERLDYIKDSIYTIHQHNVDEMIIENQMLQSKIDSMQITSDTLAARLLHTRLMVENARYYLRIANKNTSQQKFLRGWMNRALEVP